MNKKAKQIALIIFLAITLPMLFIVLGKTIEVMVKMPDAEGIGNLQGYLIIIAGLISLGVWSIISTK